MIILTWGLLNRVVHLGAINSAGLKLDLSEIDNGQAEIDWYENTEIDRYKHTEIDK